jgi:hypothetical protein
MSNKKKQWHSLGDFLQAKEERERAQVDSKPAETLTVSESTGVLTPVLTPVSTPVATPVATPVQTPVDTPVATGVDTGVCTGVDTGVSTGVGTPVLSLTVAVSADLLST